MSSRANTAPIRHPLRLFIGGEWVQPATDTRIRVFNSATEEPYVDVAEAGSEDMNRAVAAARNAFDAGPWPQFSHTERADYLRKIAAELRDRADDVARASTIETGYVFAESSMSAGFLPAMWERFADLADTFPFVDIRRDMPGSVGMIVREPVGVVAAIIPWNAPPFIISQKVAPALLAGCTVVIKASPEAPTTAYIFAEIFEKAGLPPGVVNVVTADRAVSDELVRNPGIDKVSFTGSSATGRKIAAACSERIARCTLELGGKSAGIVMDDYDIAQAAEIVAGRTVGMTGQVCALLTRIVVPRAKHDAMVDALCDRFAKVIVGDPFDPATTMGPLATRHHRERVEGYIAKGKAEGARLAFGGGRPAHLERGFFIEPTVFANVDNRSTIAREEIFGPVISVIPADSEAHAIEIANDSAFGLLNGIFTHDIERAYVAARRLRSGTVSQNTHRSDPTIGSGGFKQSGIGREGGAEGLLAFLETKTVVLDGLPASLRGEVG